MNFSLKGVRRGRARWLLRLTGAFSRLSYVLTRDLAWPYVEFLIRFWLARLFFGFGLQQLTHWDLALQIAVQQNPIPFLTPSLAVQVSTVAYLLCGGLLVVGFLTRYAAIPLLVLAIITQARLDPFDTQLFWIALFGWFAVSGAGPLSVDHLLRRGLSDSAIPVVPTLIKGSTWLRIRGAPVYLLGLRVWLAAALLWAAAGGVGLHAAAAGVARWLPLDVAARIPMLGGVLAAIALILGAGSRYVALSILVFLLGYSVVDPRMTDSIYLLMLFAILACLGGGALALEHFFTQRQSHRDSGGDTQFPKVVIVGAGFAGLRCAQGLDGARAAVTLIDRNNFHLFQPLLYQVATAALSPGDIAKPARHLFRDSPTTRLRMGTVTGIDTAKQCVRMGDDELPYDYLVLATGATHSYFGKDQWAVHAPGLKTIEDALEVRRRILIAFERAEAALNEEDRAALLTFLIVGGGPTGVELAGAIAELARFGMTKDFKSFDPASARVILVQSAAQLLPSFPQRLGKIAERELGRLGVEVRLDSRVTAIDELGVTVNDERMHAHTVLWAAGVAASPAATWLSAKADKAGRLIVEESLLVPGFKNIFAVGDTAASAAWNGQPTPGLAPAAKQAGAHAARQIRAAIEGQNPVVPFRYRHLGSLATIGRKAAVADFGGLKLWGAPAWWLWGAIHIAFMLGVRNKSATLLNWFWSYLKFDGGVRLITGHRVESK